MEFNYDLLLEYLSYKKHGTWLDFKKYVNNLIYDINEYSENDKKAITPAVVRRVFSSLGHVEFLFSESGSEYSVTPPVISILPDSSIAVLCGYRTQKFLEDVQKTCNKLNLSFYSYEDKNAPFSFFIDFKDLSDIEVFEEYFKNLGIKIIKNFSQKILSAYPYIDDIIEQAQYQEDIGQINEVYSDVWHSFRKESAKDYCICKKKSFGINKYYIYRQFEDSEKYIQVDKYIGLCKQYNVYCKNILILKDNTLYIKYLDGLPELLDRALTLASGHNRKKLGKYIFYDNINFKLAKLLSKKTGLRLEVKND